MTLQNQNEKGLWLFYVIPADSILLNCDELLYFRYLQFWILYIYPYLAKQMTARSNDSLNYMNTLFVQTNIFSKENNVN